MNRFSKRLVLLAATWPLLLLSPRLAVAQSDGYCGGVSMADFAEPIAVARVAPSQRQLNFVLSPEDGRKECPADLSKCRSKNYLVADDVVLTAPQTVKGYLCSSFVARNGRETSGWLPALALAPVQQVPAEDKDWLGTWRRIEAVIKITRPRNSSGLQIEGEATYGALDKARVARGGVNMGEFEGPARRSGETALVADASIKDFASAPSDTCAVRFRLIGPYLMVEDNMACGGANVSFTGLYSRR